MKIEFSKTAPGLLVIRLEQPCDVLHIATLEPFFVKGKKEDSITLPPKTKRNDEIKSKNQ